MVALSPLSIDLLISISFLLSLCGESMSLSYRQFRSKLHLKNIPSAAAMMHTVLDTSGGADYHRADAEIVCFESPFLFQSGCAESNTMSALVVLNGPIRRPPSPIFQRLWEASSFRVCADGGANRLYDSTFPVDGQALRRKDKVEGEPDSSDGSSSEQLEAWIPDLIRGDLDSLRSDVRAHYASRGCRVEHDPDQDSNDLDKCLQAIQAERGRRLGGKSITEFIDPVYSERVFIYGAFGGRFDQEMASFQALFKWAGFFNHKVFLYSDENCAFLLPAQAYVEIRLPSARDVEVDEEENQLLIGEGPTCGIIPLGGRCESVFTTGLKWNLDGTTALEFGGLVSTSNRIVSSVVTFRSSHPVVFTAEVLC